MERTLDVSDLEPPEPLTRAIDAAEALTPGDYLRLRHRRHPCLLEEQLALRGLRCTILPAGRDEAVEVFIWRRDDPQGARAAADAMPQPLTLDT
ncbi:DUF2249 domain-containing protein [Endothiovibrio diazotrophicus]